MSSVLFEVRGALGLITLNRPEAINALDHEMVSRIAEHLDAWRGDDGVRAVALVGAGERGLCAGGDVVAIYTDAREGGSGSVDFWRDEYTLNAAIARYPKPFVAVMDGIVLGGGIGLAAHASHRVVTETSSVGLPETTIGFVPDVGGTYLLSRAPGELGTHLALTAGSVGPGEALAVGFADAFVPRASIPSLLQVLETRDAAEAIAALAEPAPEALLPSQREWMDAAYAADDVTEILRRLDALGEPAAHAAASIRRKSPTALTVTLAALRRARKLPDLESVLNQEFRVSVHALGWPDLAEGIRAQLIDKDRNPTWSPASLSQVDPELVLEAFAPLVHELGLTRSAA